MSDEKRKEADALAAIPELETRCRRCDGRGRWGSDGTCGLCGGSGYELTEFGQKVLRLVRRRFCPLFSGE
jgi:hypothetical protein